MNKIFFVLLFFAFCQLQTTAKVEDFMKETIDPLNVKVPYVNLDYNYKSTESVPIVLEITESISTKDKTLSEGDIIQLKVKRPVYYNKTLIVQNGQIVNAKVKTIIKSGLNGIPYQIMLDDFEIPLLKKEKLYATYTKNGFNRTGFVLPLKWALTFLLPTGSLTNFIKGGHAKITPKDKITIYYFPKWGKK